MLSIFNVSTIYRNFPDSPECYSLARLFSPHLGTASTPHLRPSQRGWPLHHLPFPLLPEHKLWTLDTADELEEEEYAKENVEQASCALQDVVHATVDLEHSDQGVGRFID